MPWKTSIVIAVIVVLSACSGKESRDQGPAVCERIVSLSPSITRQIIDLEGDRFLAGITSYCPKPEGGARIVGNLVNPNLEEILRAEPDCILVSKEDSAVQKVERLSALGRRIYTFPRTRSFGEITDNYIELGAMIGRENLAREKAGRYREALATLQKTRKDLSLTLLISCTPMIPAAGRSYISDAIRLAGVKNVYAGLERPFPVVSRESLVRLNPHIIVTLSENDRELIEKELASSDNLRAHRYGTVFTMSHEHVSYYTPKDFLEAVKKISAIVEEGERRIRRLDKGHEL